ncbi:MAG: transglutaminase family protein [Novosphingobium sp.]|nr:transglutaminase family protein [Novosphingobium sp.]
MKLAIHSQLDYHFPAPTDVLLQIEAAAIPEQQIETAWIDISPVEHFARVPAQDTIGDRIWLRVQGDLRVDYTSTVSIERITTDISNLAAVPPHQLPGETVPYLLPSRYCASDGFQNLATDEFGDLQGGERIMAISEWIGKHIEYTPNSSHSGTDALETYVMRQGVCRDFAHVMIALARASTIPARFASVYGIGVEPQDFHAVAEVFLDGAWHLVDATGMSKAGEMAKIGVGRDAADVSFLTSFGPAILNNQSVEVSAA